MDVTLMQSLPVPFGCTVTFDSNGFDAGGADPYFTLFAGSDNSAIFLGSNYDPAFTTGGNFNLSYTLAAGN